MVRRLLGHAVQRGSSRPWALGVADDAVGPGLLFLKFISDAFEEHYAALKAQEAQGADPEDMDEYRAESIFWVPKEARWSNLKSQAKQPTIGKTVDDAMAAIERENPALKGVLPKDYGHAWLDKTRLGQLIDLVDCMVAMPGQLFYSTQIPVCLWFLTRNKKNGRFRGRRGEILFIDARKLGSLIDRVHRSVSSRR